MNQLFTVLETTTAANPGLLGGWGTILIYLVVIGAAMYFMIFRPQKKQQKQQDELMSSLAVGDSVLTTSGFYGVVISMVDENVVIVEFGNNKNCRIPMKKTAIVEVEKPLSAKQEAEKAAENSTTPEPEKKGLFGKKKDLEGKIKE
ncbi:MAG: preprotein translocase subunit YajC [Lachnospiraceae bacterium]|jgi:preprotein translocase subunit YajC|nr:preprotein translocase subunit YajC [Lachnospiraceae bacterium]